MLFNERIFGNKKNKMWFYKRIFGDVLTKVVTAHLFLLLFKVKSNHIKRFLAHNFLQVGFILQTSRTNNKQVISTLNFRYLQVTLKEGPKVKSDHIRRFLGHDFLSVVLTSQTSRSNNKLVISTFKFGYPCLTLKKGPKVKPDHIRRFLANNFLYRLFSHCKPLGPIISKF